ncbi:MAG: DUF2064 domain-containing protein [Gammaproteobacteria bacterium]|nr:DUF2064 domain-containing protein [Gammaproteobacteria bacterium]
MRDYPAAILIGSDCPGYDPAYLLEATRILARTDAVLGPARDGGYVLIGFSRMHEAVFEGPRWGSDNVLAVQRTRLQALGAALGRAAAACGYRSAGRLVAARRGCLDQALVIGRLSPQA